MKRIIFVASCLLFALTTCAFGQAQRVEIQPVLINDVDRLAVAQHAVTPFLESSSMVLIDLDLAKIDIPQTLAWLGTLMGSPDMAQAAAPISGFVDPLKSSGVSHVYLIASPRSVLDGSPIAVFPCQNPEAVGAHLSQFVATLPPQPPQKVHVGKDVVLAGSAKAIDRVLARNGAERPDLVLPLLASDRLDHVAVISLPNEARAELAATWPEQLPSGLLSVAVSPRQLVADLSRVVTSVQLPPESESLIRLETADDSGTARVKQIVDQVLSLNGVASNQIRVEVDSNRVELRAKLDDVVKMASAFVAPARTSARQMQRLNHLKQIAIALHNYHESERKLPLRAISDANGRPLLSWRVAILPYLEQLALYRAMKLNQPWDSNENQIFTSTRVPVYNSDPELGNKTTIRAPVFPGSVWDGDGQPRAFRDIRDGLSNTIFVIDAPVTAAVPWTSPEPWVISPDDPMSDIFGDRESVNVVMMDGAAIALNRSEMTNEKMKALLTIAGSETMERGELVEP